MSVIFVLSFRRKLCNRLHVRLYRLATLSGNGLEEVISRWLAGLRRTEPDCPMMPAVYADSLWAD